MRKEHVPGTAVRKFDYENLMPDAICVVDAEGTCLSASGACERIFGYTPAEMAGRKMLDLVHPDDRERTLQAMSRVMDGYQQRYFENRYIRKDGSVVYISWSASWSEEHQVRIGVARDVTERRFDERDRLARELLPQDPSCWQLTASPRRLISPNGVSVPLSGQDYVVLRTLMNGGECVTRKAIVEALGEDFIKYDQRRLDTQMRRLRRKIKEACGRELPVTTLRAVGYHFHENTSVLDRPD